MKTAVSQIQSVRENTIRDRILKAVLQKQGKLYFFKCYLSFSNSSLCAVTGIKCIR